MSTLLYSFVRKQFGVDPKKVTKSQIEKVAGRLAQMPTSLKDPDILLSKQLIANKETGLPHKNPNAPWNQGLYDQIKTYHTSRTQTGKPYTRSYNVWSKSEISVLKLPKTSFSRQEKIDVLVSSGRTESSVVTKMGRLGV